MSLVMLLRVFSDCCVCFAVLGAFPSVFPAAVPLVLPALVCAGCAGLSAFLYDRAKFALSRLCAALPLLTLLMAQEWQQALILCPAALYTAAVLLRGEPEVDYYSYRQLFTRTLTILTVTCLVLGGVSFMERRLGSATPLVHADVTVQFTLLHLLCGVVLQRQLRLGTARSHGTAGQMGALLGGPAAVLLVLGTLWALVKDAFGALFRLVTGLLFSAVSVDTTPAYQESPSVPTTLPSPAPTETPLPSAPISTAVPELPPEALEQSGELILWWIVPVAAVLLVLLGLMLLSFGRGRGAVPTAERVERIDPPEPPASRERRSNRARVRRVYRDFLRQEQKRGVRLTSHDTSADVLGKLSADTDPEAAARLRELYLRARYDESRDVTRAQADAARAEGKSCRSRKSGDTP